ncbi:MAG: circadian phase modifier CpmA, partial [Proteobacteria bacterium]|nr:circadian phase modifier CpmA [Pseudomonadota bacterium]
MLDLERQARLGFDEAIYAEGKNEAQLGALVEFSAQANQRRLFTRLSEHQFSALSEQHRGMLDYDPISGTAILGTCRLSYATSRVAIVCAGSSDIGASSEAVRTLTYYGHPSTWVPDVGVAGLWRLLERLNEIRDKDV